MTKAELKLSDYYDVYALHRALLEAKFTVTPRDADVQGSPYIARVANRVMDTLIQMERNLGREEYARAWESKRQMNPDLFPDYWNAALRGVKGIRDWLNWSEAQKKDYAAILLGPFVAADDVMQRFLKEADKWAQD